MLSDSGGPKLRMTTSQVGPRLQHGRSLKEIKEQFLPSNVAWMAREALKRLKHRGVVREYVKEFSSLMFDIKNMSDDDKLFNLMSSLQGWAHTELRKQGVRDLPIVMATADCLVDYKMGGTISTTLKVMPKGAKKVKYEAKTSKKSRWKKQKKKKRKLRSINIQKGMAR